MTAAHADPARSQSVLFTAFEPSGDEHAAVVIRELRRRRPDVTIYSWGGERMEQAGATVVERTGDDAAMGMPGLAKIAEHKRINARIEAWIGVNRPSLLVPVDSPAANFPICAIARRHDTPIVHLVAPQMWAWGAWRVKKLRRLTDLVLCLLPFEEEWFERRGVRARFIGHPIFDSPLDEDALERAIAGFPEGAPKIALMPGSRPAEITKNFPILLDAFRMIRSRKPNASGVVAAASERVRERVRELAVERGGWPKGLHVEVGGVDSAARWCDVALAVSGTVTLRIARQRTPMVVVYRVGALQYRLIGQWLLASEHISLPNLIAGRRIVPELAPKLDDDAAPLAAEALRLIDDASAREAQRSALEAVVRAFDGRSAATCAADAIEDALKVGRFGEPPR